VFRAIVERLGPTNNTHATGLRYNSCGAEMEKNKHQYVLSKIYSSHIWILVYIN